MNTKWFGRNGCFPLLSVLYLCAAVLLFFSLSVAQGRQVPLTTRQASHCCENSPCWVVNPAHLVDACQGRAWWMKRYFGWYSCWGWGRLSCTLGSIWTALCHFGVPNWETPLEIFLVCGHLLTVRSATWGRARGVREAFGILAAYIYMSTLVLQHPARSFYGDETENITGNGFPDTFLFRDQSFSVFPSLCFDLVITKEPKIIFLGEKGQ